MTCLQCRWYSTNEKYLIVSIFFKIWDLIDTEKIEGPI